jgi:uncharacterized membrane protein
MDYETKIYLDNLIEAVDSPDWWIIVLTVINIVAFIVVAWTQIKIQKHQTKLQEQQKKAQEYDTYRLLYALIKESNWYIKSFIRSLYSSIIYSRSIEEIRDELENMQKRLYGMENRLMQQIIDFELKLPNGETIVKEYQSVLLLAGNISGYLSRIISKDDDSILKKSKIEYDYTMPYILRDEFVMKNAIVARISEEEKATFFRKTPQFFS